MQAIQTPSRRWTGATQLTLGLTVERHRACEGFGGRFYFLPPCASTAPYPVLTCRVQVYLNHELKFGYVHLFKNGGSAILSNLNALLCKRQGKDPECGKQMKHVECLEPFNDCPDIKDYFTFTFSRNPWDRAVSMWSYGLKKLQKAQSSDAARRKVESSYCSLQDMLNLAYKYHLRSSGRGKRRNQGAVSPANSGCGGHWAERQWKPYWSEHGSPINFIGRLEHFERDWATVLERIDASGALLRLYRAAGFEMANDSGHRPFTSYYTPDLRALVARIWASDVRELRYVFEHQAASNVNVSSYKDGASAHVLGLGVLESEDEGG